jgi:hypothetical protein
MEIAPSDRLKTPAVSVRSRSRPASTQSKRLTIHSVRRFGTGTPSVCDDYHERPRRRFKSARLIGEWVYQARPTLWFILLTSTQI